MLYLAVKTLHILSAMLLFGTGLGSAYYLLRAHRSGDVRAIAVTARHVVTADWLFTSTSALVQPITGIWLASLLGIPLTQPWLLISIGLYAVAGACWLPVVWIQIRVRDLAVHAATGGTPLPPAYYRYMRVWFLLGWPAFAAMLAILGLMVFKGVLLSAAFV